ncbi:MAG TPA: hypothetical protein VF121_11765 [Thermoanaerobaculia bacterium]|nr:hypothetical protein [Thermoanaerobaculia bacterium]
MRRRLTALPIVLALLAAPAAAETFQVTLADGSGFETRYQPQEASWDPSVVLFLSEAGNWIGVPKDLIAAVVSDVDDTGFGTRIDSTTISLGNAPNDAALPEEQQVAAGMAAPGSPAAGAAAAANAQNALLDAYLQQRAAEQSYSIQQFVEPNQTQGIPSRFVGPPSGGTTPFPPR